MDGGSGRRVGATKECRCGREDASVIIRSSAGKRQKPSSIGVSNFGNRAVAMADSQEEVEHPLNPLRDKGRDCHPVACGQHQKVQVNLDRVALITGGLLEVDTIREYLLVILLDEDLRAQCAPPLGRSEFREHDSCVEEAQRLAGEMGVGGEIVREIPFDVRGVGPYPSQQTEEEHRTQHL